MNDFGDFIRQYYQQYGNQPTEATLKSNLEKFRNEHKAKLNEAGRHFVYDPIAEYDRQIAERALNECKNSDEWRALEADDIRFKSTGVMSAMSAEELLERYRQKIQQAYRAEAWFSNQIRDCETKLTELKSQEQTKSVKNKTKHWAERKLTCELGLCEQIQKTNRYERLIMKWLGICQKIQIADVKNEIKRERQGDGNKYGYNPNMASRETATGIFEED